MHAVENWTFNALTLYGHSILHKKKKKDPDDILKNGGKRSCIRSIKRVSVSFSFFFITLFQIEGGPAEKGNDGGRSTHSHQANDSAVQKEFCRRRSFIFQCRGAATGVAGAVKVAPRGHQRERLVRHFPNYHPISFFLFFLLLFVGTP